MTEGFAAVGLHRPSRPENIGGVFRAADVYGVRLVVLGGGELPPEPLGQGTPPCVRASCSPPMRYRARQDGIASAQSAVSPPTSSLAQCPIVVRQGGSVWGTMALRLCPARATEESSRQRQAVDGGLN